MYVPVQFFAGWDDWLGPRLHTGYYFPYLHHPTPPSAATTTPWTHKTAQLHHTHHLAFLVPWIPCVHLFGYLSARSPRFSVPHFPHFFRSYTVGPQHVFFLVLHNTHTRPRFVLIQRPPTSKRYPIKHSPPDTGPCMAAFFFPHTFLTFHTLCWFISSDHGFLPQQRVLTLVCILFSHLITTHNGPCITVFPKHICRHTISHTNTPA